MSKILTDELIREMMIHRGWQEFYEDDQECKRKIVLEHYEVEFTDRFDNNCGYYIYGETTRDGYEVFVAADDVRNVCISEDVYTYESDLHDALIDAIKDELSPIYLDDEDADFVDYAIEQLYEFLYQEKYNKVESELEDQGYEWPEKIEA
tara:strand:+ start:128 stop:577 length:450 start_codon:yes stop_codon:yes gene_type:complete